jgi:hypothetical protein
LQTFALPPKFLKIFLLNIQLFVILQLQDKNKCDITSRNQHGLKKRSTSTLSMELKSIIARFMDEDSYILISRIDLSSAFDISNVSLY